MSDNRKEVARAINAYGQAIRGDWSLIDGRTVRSNLNELTEWLSDNQEEIGFEDLCRDVGVCWKWECWPEYCEERISDHECVHMDENSFEVRK